ncbi:MAG: YIP1 family protein [Actinomycetota bacterium]|nr:YIP1 family protein [Actinomycetota bacterium]
MRRGSFRQDYASSGRYSRESFFDALREVWLAPGRFFRELDPGGGYIRPALFVSAVLYLNIILEAALSAIWNVDFQYSLIYAPLVGLVVAVVLGPLLVAGLAALVLVVMDGAPSGTKFGPVFRALGYVSGIGIVIWIPFGPFLAIPYGAVVATVAVKETLGVGWSRAATATLVPLGAILLIMLLLTGATETYELLRSPAGG